MTNKKQELRERIEREFGVCDIHIQRINEAIASFDAQLPMTSETYVDLREDQVRCLDQFIFRFSKLQDAMGAKLFSFILDYLDEDVSTLPMRDILNKLERYSIIKSADEWVYIRELRNEIAHDYPLPTDDVVSMINELFYKYRVLLEIYQNLKTTFFQS